MRIVNIASSQYKAQYEIMSVTCCVCYISKLLFVLSFMKQSAFWICCAFRNGFSFASSTDVSIFVIIAVIIFFQRPFPMCFAVFSDFLIQLFLIGFCRGFNFHFPILFLVCTGFNMCSVYKYSTRIYISAVYCFLKDFLEDSFKNLCPLKSSRIIFTEC